jgi:amidase
VPTTRSPEDLALAGAARQAELVRAGDVAPRELVEACLRRIERLDPDLNAFRKVLAERALGEADEADARLRAGEEALLLGVPVAIKDDTAVAGEPLTYGTNAAGGPEPADWEIVRRLRAAGAVVVGITNVPELLIWPFTETPTNGITRNPWDRQRVPGGSSGGSAAAVAAGLVPLATASDGGGSIRIPAASCGLVGLKPEHDRIPHNPAGEGWHGLSSAGFVARTVTDCALAYEAVTGEPWTAAAAREPGRLRIALTFKVPPGLVAKVDGRIRRATQEVADLLRSLGHEVVERDPDYGWAALNWSARYFRGIHDDARSMAHPERLEPRTKGMARIGRLLGQPTLDRALAARESDRARVNAIFDDVDVILGPGTATLPPEVGRWTAAGALRTFNGVARFVPFQAVWNHLGNPAMTFPSGASAEGVPLSVQVVARPRAEETLLALAAQVERARPWADRHPPLAGDAPAAA